MAISPEDIQSFREEIKALLAESDDDSVEFSICDIALLQQLDSSGEPIWEFMAENYQPAEGRKNIWELFEAVSNEFEIEQDGFEDFYVSPV